MIDEVVEELQREKQVKGDIEVYTSSFEEALLIRPPQKTLKPLTSIFRLGPRTKVGCQKMLYKNVQQGTLVTRQTTWWGSKSSIDALYQSQWLQGNTSHSKLKHCFVICSVFTSWSKQYRTGLIGKSSLIMPAEATFKAFY